MAIAGREAIPVGQRGARPNERQSAVLFRLGCSCRTRLPTRARRTAEADAGACLPSLTQLLRGGRATNQPDLAAVRLQGPNQPFAILGGLRSPPPPAGLMTGANREAQHSCNSSKWIPCRCCRAGATWLFGTSAAAQSPSAQGARGAGL